MGNWIKREFNQIRFVRKIRFLVNERRQRKEQLNADALMQDDPDANYKPFTERRYIVWATDPTTGFVQRAQVLRKNVMVDGKPKYVVRWGRYAHKEPDSDVMVDEDQCEVDDFSVTPSSRFSHYMSFVQTVGLPVFDFREGEVLYCREVESDQWLKAMVKLLLRQYQRMSNMPGEWVHRASMRLRKALELPVDDPGLSAWDTLYELDWIRVRHPAINQYKPAKIVQKIEPLPGRPGTGSILVQYEDSSLLLKQEVIYEYDVVGLNNKEQKIEFFDNWKKRWRYNRLFVYRRAMKAVGLTIHEMSGDNGHSLFRALSQQLLGTDENYLALRRRCFMYIVKHKKYFQHFLDVNFEVYAAMKKRALDGEFFAIGDHLDIQAVCELYDVRCEVYSELSPKPLEAMQFYPQMKDLPVVRLSYRGGAHYDSVEFEDDPLPISLEINLRKVPVGQITQVRGIVRAARTQEYERTERVIQALHHEQYGKRKIFVVEALVKFDMEEVTLRVLGLLKVLGISRNLPTQLTEADLQLDRTNVWESQRFQVRVRYPAQPACLDESENPNKCPLLEILGDEEAIRKATDFIHGYQPEVKFRIKKMMDLNYKKQMSRAAKKHHKRLNAEKQRKQQQDGGTGLEAAVLR